MYPKYSFLAYKTLGTSTKYSNTEILITGVSNTGSSIKSIQIFISHYWGIKHWALVQSIQILGTSTKYSNTHYWDIKHWAWVHSIQILITEVSNTGSSKKYSIFISNYLGIKHWAWVHNLVYPRYYIHPNDDAKSQKLWALKSIVIIVMNIWIICLIFAQTYCVQWLLNYPIVRSK